MSFWSITWRDHSGNQCYCHFFVLPCSINWIICILHRRYCYIGLTKWNKTELGPAISLSKFEHSAGSGQGFNNKNKNKKNNNSTDAVERVQADWWIEWGGKIFKSYWLEKLWRGWTCIATHERGRGHLWWTACIYGHHYNCLLNNLLR